MGGIKNLEEKKKKNRVFSSGAGGGGKGPAVIDKRNQEQKCPFCDKVYTQSGRLKEHINAKHADQQQQDSAAADAAPSTSISASAGPSRPAASAPKAAAASSKIPPSSSNSHVSPPGVPAAAGSSSSTAGSSSSSSAPAQGDMMDMGSRAGYFTSKSPKMHLHEWCQKEKLLKPRYNVRQQDDGAFTCKVVLPHPKKSEEDIVVFLDPQWAVPDAQEAEQRAAVAALNRVAGERQFHLLLPKPYVPLWEELGKAASAKAAAAVARAAAEEQRRQRDRERAQREALRAPQAVVMSEAKQALVQSILKEGRMAAAAPPPTVGSQGNLAGMADFMDKLTALGFTGEQAAMAVASAGPTTDVNVLLEWLFIHLPAAELPAQYRAGSKTNAVTLLATPASNAHYAASASRLAVYGYSMAECQAALQATDGDELAALTQLYEGLTGAAVGSSTAGEQNPGLAPEGEEAGPWADERMVLEAIYNEDATFPSPNSVQLSLTLPEECSVASRGPGSADVKLLIEFHNLAGPSGYPTDPPLLAVSCPALAPPYLQYLTRQLASSAAKHAEAGEPMLHELASQTVEICATLDESMLQQAVKDAGDAEGAVQLGADEQQMAGDNVEDLDDQYDDDEGELVESFEGLVLESNDRAAASPTAPDAQQQPACAAQHMPRQQQQPSRMRAAAAAAAAAADAQQVAAESERLLQRQHQLLSLGQHAEMQRQRQALPAYSKRGELLELVQKHAVIVISGATGCGKSTQVPQYLLEDAIAQGHGGATNIIVTQPRRISALGLASRVAQERGEEVGGVVGYSVRLDSKVSARTRLLFCTTGILLRRLLSEPQLQDVTHVILDEVHERSVEIDLLLLLLRDVVAARCAAAAAAATGAGSVATPTPLRLVLMSATANAELFANYMHAASPKGSSKAAAGGSSSGYSLLRSVGQLVIPGFTYPVHEFYLEDVFEMTGHVLAKKSRCTKKLSKADAEAAEEKLASAWEAEGRDHLYSQQTLRSMVLVDEEQINYEALVDLITHIVQQSATHHTTAFLSDWPDAQQYLRKAGGGGSDNTGGAVLVFLPGAPEISRALRALQASQSLVEAAGGQQRLKILPLHGSLSSADQAKVFARFPAGTTKVVLATNVAETSITIDDVSFVVDTGRAKEMLHDADRGILRLQEQWVSQAAAQQRRGRAGRVRPGVCFRLYSRMQWGAMSPHTQPEMLRSPLERVCMLIKGMHLAGKLQAVPAAAPAAPAPSSSNGSDVANVLARCLSPPESAAVKAAVDLLTFMRAFDEREELTALGQHLNKMPMDPRLGKMLVYGAMLGCLDPVLTVAAALAHGRPIFLSAPPDQQQELAAARAPLLALAGTARSDHIALVAAFDCWSAAVAKGGRTAGFELAHRYSLSESSLEAIQAGRVEYATLLADLGFLPREAVACLAGGSGGGRSRGGYTGSRGSSSRVEWLAHPANKNAGNARFLKASICAGFYPNILRVQHPAAKYKQVDGGAFETEANAREVKFFDCTRGRAFIHPTSVNFTAGKFNSGWLVYTSMTATSKLFVRESSMVPVYALLLFGGRLEVYPDRDLLTVDDWAQFKARPSVGVMVKHLRAELDAVLADKIRKPDMELSASKVAQAVMELLDTDGF